MRMSKILRTAVVGLGRIAWERHLKDVDAHPGFRLAAVVDPLEERRSEARERFGAPGFESVENLLSDMGEELDLVVLASPTPYHADQALACFAAGCDVFCDKPMASSLAEADRMIAAMQARGRKLMVFQPHRVAPVTRALRAILEQGLLGELFMIRAEWAGYDRRNDWQAFRRHGGGLLNNYGAHMVDMLLYLTRSRMARTSCALRSIATMGDADDVVKITGETESGVILDCCINWASPFGGRSVAVYGDRGAARHGGEIAGWEVKHYLPEEAPAVAVQEGMAAEGRRYGSGAVVPWRTRSYDLPDADAGLFYRKCYEYFAEDKPPFVPIAESREVMRVLDECRRTGMPRA